MQKTAVGQKERLTQGIRAMRKADPFGPNGRTLDQSRSGSRSTIVLQSAPLGLEIHLFPDGSYRARALYSALWGHIMHTATTAVLDGLSLIQQYPEDH